MSNAAIIARIKEELVAFERKERTCTQLETILAGHFEALEGISYRQLQLLRAFESRIVKADCAEEGFPLEPTEAVLGGLRAALDALEKEANQSPEQMPLKRHGSSLTFGKKSDMISPEELIRTIYLGDRGCCGFSADSLAKRVLISVDCISRVRSADGKWNFYADEDIEGGMLAFGGVSWFEMRPPGPLPEDYIGELRIESVEDGVYSFYFEAGAALPQPHLGMLTTNIEIRIKAREFYLLDPRIPDQRIY